MGQDGNSTTWCHLVSMIYLLCIVQYAPGLIVKIMQTDAVAYIIIFVWVTILC